MSDIAYYEDLEVGSKSAFGHYEVTREEVVDFAGKYDPQPFHLDDAAAAKTHFGKLSASGWHTCAMTMAMLVKEWSQHRVASLGSPGIDELRWLKPVQFYGRVWFRLSRPRVDLSAAPPVRPRGSTTAARPT